VRRWNPLGFKVVELTSEPEVIAPPAAAGNRSDPGVPASTAPAARGGS